MAIISYLTENQYSQVLSKLKTSLNLTDTFFQNVSAVLMLKALGNIVGGNRPFQKNVEDVKDILPIVIRSEYFNNWRYKYKAICDGHDCHIVIRPNNQNNYEYAQLTFDGAALELKGQLKENDKLIIVKKRNSDTYEIFKIPRTDTRFDENDDFVAINPKIDDRTFFDAPVIEIGVKDKKYPLNQILYGAPGTGKTHNAINHALAIITGKDLQELIDAEKINPANRVAAKKEYDELVESGQIQFVSFHQSYSYEEFVEGIKASVIDKNIEYNIEPGVFKKMCKRASESNSDKKFVLIIDEINRGNISKIFGELISLIEDSKRIGEDEALKVRLTYSGTDENSELFGVPNNLYLIGTMNSADRSIALIDTALRRRFTFIEYIPDSSILRTDIEGINIQRLVEKMNQRIEFLLDKDHMLGHAYFINLRTKNDLCGIFKNKIIPLLEEYFYGDYEKISLVLGDNNGWGKSDDLKIIQLKRTNTQNFLFGSNTDEFDDKTIYQLNPILIEDKFDEIPNKFFISIYEKL